MAGQTIEERLEELKQKRDHVGDLFGAADLQTLIEAIEYAMSHGGDVSVAVTPVENGYKITVTDTEGNVQEATVTNGGDAYEVYKSTVPSGQEPMSKTEWLATLKGEKGNDGHNPCLGVFADASSLPTTDVQEGDYAYADVSEVSHIFRYNGSAWVDKGEGSPDNQTKFDGGNGPAVPSVAITDDFVEENTQNKIADARQINKIIDIEEVVGKNLLYIAWYDGYYDAAGALKSGSLYKRTKIPCKPSTTYFLSASSENMGSSSTHVVLKNADNNFISDVGSTERVGMQITTTSETAFICISVYDTASNLQLEVGTSRTAYEEPFVPYTVPHIKNAMIKDGSLGAEKLMMPIVSQITEEEGTLADGRQVNNLLDFNDVVCKNMLYYTWYSKFYDSTGTLQNGNLYHHMAVPCKPSTTYFLSASTGNIGSSSAYVVLLDESKAFISAVADTSRRTVTIETTAETAYIGVSAAIAAVNLQLELGGVRTAYVEPFAPYRDTKIKEEMLPAMSIPDGYITRDMIAPGVSLPASPNSFTRIMNSDVALAAGGVIYTPFIECPKNVSLSAVIRSAFEEVRVGVGYQGFYGASFIITSTNIKMVKGNDDTQVFDVAHGLTIGATTTLLVTKGVAQSDAFLLLFDDAGGMFKRSITYGIYSGRPYLKNNGTAAISAEVAFVPKDINRRIWMFGDSYFSYGDAARWTYYLIQDGFVANLLIARGGDTATNALNSLTTLLATGARPTYLLWCMGMNSGGDGTTAPNSTWLEKTQAMLALCVQYSITPILATIPTVPSEVHDLMNQWIRNSGERYVDMAAAVEQSGTQTWKGWGTDAAMLSSDQVHPTSYGAKALYAAIIAEFPEITVVE